MGHRLDYKISVSYPFAQMLVRACHTEALFTLLGLSPRLRLEGHRVTELRQAQPEAVTCRSNVV